MNQLKISSKLDKLFFSLVKKAVGPRLVVDITEQYKGLMEQAAKDVEYWKRRAENAEKIFSGTEDKLKAMYDYQSKLHVEWTRKWADEFRRNGILEQQLGLALFELAEKKTPWWNVAKLRNANKKERREAKRK